MVRSLPFIAIHQAGKRWFWVAWYEDYTGKPDFSGYAASKEAAVAAACAALQAEPDQVSTLKAGVAKQWRGISCCKACGSQKLEVLPGKAHLTAGLKCIVCGRFNKWLSESQLILLRELQHNASQVSG